MSPEATNGLKNYIEGPLRRQIECECRATRPPDRVSVVFGHTHKPFERCYAIPGYEHGVEVFTTGGWVVDTVERQPFHGGSMVLVDEHCQCAALRLYNEAVDGQTLAPVRVAVFGENELSGALQERLDKAVELWAAFTESVSAAIDVRARALAQRAR